MLLLPNTCSIILYEAVEGLAILREEVCTIRIERFWRDLFSGCTGLFYHLFNHMEISGILDPTNEAHLFSLHYVFLPIINRNLAVFQQGQSSDTDRKKFVTRTMDSVHMVHWINIDWINTSLD